jgi:hypothetical protein
MPSMFCPQCGRELSLDSGDVRFCRYCGFSLLDTKESLQGYSKQKRIGFSVVTWSYALLLIVTLLLHGAYIPLATGWGYWTPAILIVVSVSLFVSAAVSALKPAMFSKSLPGGKGALSEPLTSTDILNAKSHPERPMLVGEPERITARVEPASVTESTTRRLG